MGGYEHRPAQLEMAQAVDHAFENHHHAIVEAGTGTGKTLASRLPAICSGRRVVISTATKSLQEQLYQKDVPFLQKHFAPNLKVAVMKGRSNFLCLAKMHALADQPMASRWTQTPPRATHTKYGKACTARSVSGEKALADLATQAAAVAGLLGRYGEESGLACKQAAEISTSKPERL